MDDPTLGLADLMRRDRLKALGEYHVNPPLDHRVASASCDLCREAREIKRKLGEAD
jgi:hypothetical protein